MHFVQEDCTSELRVSAYDEGVVTIGETRYRESLILTRERLIPDWRPQRPGDLRAADLDVVREVGPEILLLGTGSAIHFPSPAVTAGLLEAGIGVEVMDTAAACRTYNILLSEERDVVAALLLGA
ncbi:MAG: Mth938-like domain-containing protein [Gammaproteobacteria bacterium]|jgi:uncharacterized protein